MGKEPLIVRFILFIIKMLGQFMDFSEKKLSLYRYVMITSFIFVILPVITVWIVFAIAAYLPNPFRFILLWSLILTLTLLCAVVDYIRAH